MLPYPKWRSRDARHLRFDQIEKELTIGEVTAMDMSLKIGSIALDCSDVDTLINFYARVTGTTVFYQNDDFACINVSDYWLAVHRVDDYLATTWPDATVPKQMHLDFGVDDLEVAGAFVLECGAVKSEYQSSPDGRWVIYFDPAGHPFCLSTLVPDPATM
jgi:predicted enzyme related to lactoylglutathione lyase